MRVNEAYPDPDRDINEDGIADQNDEFIELFNCGDENAELDGWTISDNGGSFVLSNVSIAGRGYLYLPRTLTNIVLGANENISLKDASGNYVDHLSFESAKKGMSYHRAPDGSERIRALRDPTPGNRNHLPPSLIINEVMPDPIGKNAMGQWAEVLNLGDAEDLKGARLTNTQSVDLVLPALVLGPDERAIICIGNSDRLGPCPPDVQVVQLGSSSTLYVVGDELQLVDPEGYAMDYVAWGSSSHVGDPLVLPGNSRWYGKVWDRNTSSMSVEGYDNPTVIEGISLMRAPDGNDTDSPLDWIMSPYVLKGTPGWSNDDDISLRLSGPGPRIEFDTGQELTVFITLEIPGRAAGNITLDISVEGQSWTITTGIPEILTVNGEENISFLIAIIAPEVLLDHMTTMTVSASWQGRDWYRVSMDTLLLIPSVDLLFEDVSFISGSLSSESTPQGLIIDVEGYVKNGGELRSGEIIIDLEIFRDGSETRPIDRIRIDGASPGMRRIFRSSVDTLDLEGNWTIRLMLDSECVIPEFDETNNEMIRNISVLPTPVLEGEAALVITSVLWNTSSSSRFATIRNPLPYTVDMSNMYLTDGVRSVRFPEGALIFKGEDIGIVWGESALERLTHCNNTFRCEEKGDREYRMVLEGALPDPSSTGILRLDTRYRKTIDIVCLKRGIPDRMGWTNIGSRIVETTYGTVAFRLSRYGRHIDTDTSLDWSVNSGHCRIDSFLIDPQSGRSSEFVSIRFDKDVDPSGFMVMCNDRVSVIPNGTRAGQNGVITIAGSIEHYMGSQGVRPDLIFGEGETSEGGIVVAGTKVPGYPSLILPNAGAAMYLMDPAGMVIDSVEWGSSGIGAVKGDIVVRSRWDYGKNPRWNVGGTGSLPLGTALSGADLPGSVFSCFADRSDGSHWICKGDDLIALAGAVDPELVRVAEEVFARGGNVTLYVGELEAAIGDDVHADPLLNNTTAELAGYLKGLGARVLFREGFYVPLDMYACGSRLLMARHDMTENTRGGPSSFSIPVIGYDLERPSYVREIMRMMIGRDDEWIELPGSGGPSIGSMSRIYENNAECELEMSPFPEVNINEFIVHPASTVPTPIIGEEEVFIFDARGNMDLPGILQSLDAMSNVKLLLGPGAVRPVLDRDGRLYNEFLKRMEQEGGDLVHTHFRNHLSDAVSMQRYAGERGLDLEIRVIYEDPQDQGFGGMIEAGINSFFLMDMPSGMINPFWLGHSSFEDPYGDMVKDLLWSASQPLPEGFIGDQNDLIDVSPHSGLVIEEIYPDTYLPGDPDEYVAIYNTGCEPIQLEGCSISDDEGLGLSGDGTIIFAGDIVLGPGERSFLTWNRSAFGSQNGYPPHLALDDAPSGASNLIVNGFPRLANENDSVCLRDPRGVVIDVVPYGRCNWEGLYWPRADGGSWSGPPVPVPGSGHILYRVRDGWGGGMIDRDKIDDWLSTRPRHPGQSRYGPFSVGADANVRFGVCPDTSSDLLREIVEGARKELLVNIYEMNSAWITAALLGARERGVSVKMLVEGQPVGGMSWEQIRILSYLSLGGVEVKVLYNDPSGIRDRYRFDHAKYIVADGIRVMISSDNFKDTSFPPPGLLPLTGTRGWVALVESPETALTVSEVFIDDWSGPDVRDPDTLDEEITDLTTIYRPDTVPIADLPHLDVVESMELDSISVLLSPDHISLNDNPLLRALKGAKFEIVAQLMSLAPTFDTANQRNSMLPETAPDAILYKGSHTENPYLAALFHAAKNGVRVRLMLDGTDFDMDGHADNLNVARWIEEEALSRGLSDLISVRVMPSISLLPGRSIGLVHNKGVVIDSRFCWLSSLNWGPTSALENREMGFLMESDELGSEMMRVLETDWGLTLQNEVALMREGIKITRIEGDLLRVSVYVKGLGEGSEGSRLILVDNYSLGETHPGWSWSDMSARGNITCVEYSGVIPGDGRLFLLGSEGERTAFLMEIRFSYLEEESIDGAGYPLYREPLFPVVMVLISAILISVFISLIGSKTRKARREEGPGGPGSEE